MLPMAALRLYQTDNLAHMFIYTRDYAAFGSLTLVTFKLDGSRQYLICCPGH